MHIYIYIYITPLYFRAYTLWRVESEYNPRFGDLDVRVDLCRPPGAGAFLCFS